SSDSQVFLTRRSSHCFPTRRSSDLHVRVGRGFEIHQFARFAQLVCQPVLFFTEQEGDRNAQGHAVIFKQFLGAAVNVPHAANSLATVGQQRCRNRRHTRAKRQRRFRLLQPGQSLFQFTNARVGAPARVQVAFAAPFNHIQQRGGVLEPVGGGVVHRRVGAAELILVAAVVDDAGGGALVVWGGHGGSFAFIGRGVGRIVDCCVLRG